MRAERFTRKTHLKKHAALPALVDGVAVPLYDLTESENAAQSTFSLSALRQQGNISYEDIITLPYAFENEADIMIWCAAIVAESPTAKLLWQEAEEKGWSVGLTDLKNGGFYVDIPQKTLYLDHFSMVPSALGRSIYFRNAVLMTFVHALRDIGHEICFGAFEEGYAPEAVLMLERVRAADCDTVTVLVCWELRGAGYTDVWRHLLGSEEGDMAMVFTRFLERDPTALFDGAALSYAFRQWYADENRVDGCDHETLESLDSLLQDQGTNNSFGQKDSCVTLIEALSILPDDICYLEGLGNTIKKDPFFAGMNDPINQTHLFHLIYDMEVTMVNNVPFRDINLARKIFPQGDSMGDSVDENAAIW